MSRIFVISLTWIVFSQLGYADDHAKALDVILGSAELTEQRAAFEKIAASPDQYVSLVRNRLIAVANGNLKPDLKSLDRLFYLAAFLKDKSLARPIETLWQDTSFLPDYCVYSCPMVFALTIYATSDLWTPPKNIKRTFDRHGDLYTEIRMASEISLEPTPEEHRARGPGIDRYLEEMAKESEKQLIEKAGPNPQEYLRRMAAAYQLSYSVSSSRNLKDLYWVSIQEAKLDGAYEFRWAIYNAVYRAEKAHRAGR